MFLSNIFSSGAKIVPQETLSGLRCPNCGRRSVLSLFRGEQTLRLLGVTILRWRVRCFAVCAACGHIFEAAANASHRPK